MPTHLFHWTQSNDELNTLFARTNSQGILFEAKIQGDATKPKPWRKTLTANGEVVDSALGHSDLVSSAALSIEHAAHAVLKQAQKNRDSPTLASARLRSEINLFLTDQTKRESPGLPDPNPAP